MTKIEEWLSEFSKPNTKLNYERHINKFFGATGLDEEKLIEMSIENIKHRILIYRNEELKRGVKQNTVLAVIGAVRSFLIQINKPIKFRRNALGKVQADTDSHVFSNGDLKTLFDVGNTEEKAIIATASSLGWEISSFLALERETIKRKLEWAKANNMKFIFFEDTREKTSEARLAILNPLAIQCLNKYFETTKSKEPQLFAYTSDGIQKMLNRLAVNSGLKTTGNLRFHNIRKWLMSRLSRCGFNDFQIKFVLGKSIGVSDRTYLQTLQSEVEEKYPKVYEDYLNIAPDLNSTAKMELVKLQNLKTEFDTTKDDLLKMILAGRKENEDLKGEMENMHLELVTLREVYEGVKQFLNVELIDREIKLMESKKLG